jgi:hypothetical protein
MGRRSRKRLSEGEPVSSPPAGGSTRAERDSARRRRAAAAAAADTPRPRQARPSREPRERPPAPWGRFPLTELVVLLAILCLVSAFFFHGERSRTLLAGGAALGSLGGLELSIREHFAGFKSHSTMLGAAAGVVTMVVLVLVVHPISIWIVLLSGIGVFGAAFWLLREAFKKRSGGVGFR